MRVPYVSIIVITTGKNLVNIKRLLLSIKAQNYKDYEVIIATESNGAKLTELCISLGLNCTILETGCWNKCKTANLAIVKSKGKLIALLEDDVELEPCWLSKMIECLNTEKNAGCVYCVVINPLGSESITTRTSKRAFHYVVRAINTLKAHYCIARKGLKVFSLTVLCRREALLRAGVFDMNVEEPIQAEDYDLAIRIQKAGYKIMTCNEVKVRHYTRHTYKRALLTLKKGPKWWGKLVENDTYLFAKHWDLLGISIFTHALYNAIFTPFALILQVKRLPGIAFFTKLFLHAIKGSFTGLIRGLCLVLLTPKSNAIIRTQLLRKFSDSIGHTSTARY